MLGYITCSFKKIIITPNLTGCSAFKVKYSEISSKARERRQGLFTEGPSSQRCRPLSAYVQVSDLNHLFQASRASRVPGARYCHSSVLFPATHCQEIGNKSLLLYSQFVTLKMQN